MEQVTEAGRKLCSFKDSLFHSLRYSTEPFLQRIHNILLTVWTNKWMNAVWHKGAWSMPRQFCKPFYQNPYANRLSFSFSLNFPSFYAPWWSKMVADSLSFFPQNIFSASCSNWWWGWGGGSGVTHTLWYFDQENMAEVTLWHFPEILATSIPWLLKHPLGRPKLLSSMFCYSEIAMLEVSYAGAPGLVPAKPTLPGTLTMAPHTWVKSLWTL